MAKHQAPHAKHKPSTGTKQQAQSTSQAHTAKLHAAAVGAALKFKLLCYCAKGIKANWNQLNIFGRASTKIVTKKSASSGSCRRCSIVMPIVNFLKTPCAYCLYNKVYNDFRNDAVIDGDRDGGDEIDGSRVQSPPAGCDLSFVSVVDQDRPPTS